MYKAPAFNMKTELGALWRIQMQTTSTWSSTCTLYRAAVAYVYSGTSDQGLPPLKDYPLLKTTFSGYPSYKTTFSGLPFFSDRFFQDYPR